MLLAGRSRRSQATNNLFSARSRDFQGAPQRGASNDAAQLAEECQRQLTAWNISADELAHFPQRVNKGQPYAEVADVPVQRTRARLRRGLRPPAAPPANPPTKRPTVALMKQGRAFGIGVVVATQNPMDLDYRALTNAGFWAVGRLQTDADRERVVDSLANAHEAGSSAEEIENVIRRLQQRWLLVRNVHATPHLAHAAALGDVVFAGADDARGCEEGGGAA